MSTPIPMDELRQSAADVDIAVALPPAAFSSPEFYEFELDAVWYREWICIGRVTDIPNPGDYFTVKVGHEPMIVLRDEQGAVAVRSAVCQHRAMIIAEDRGNARRFRCPYHSWVYGLDGGLRSAPDLNDHPTFDRSSVCLPEIHSEVWEGFVFVNVDGTAAPLQERLGTLAEQLADYKISELRAAEPMQLESYEWNWKIFGDECYHCAHLHSRTWHKMYPTPSERVDPEVSVNDPARGIIAYEIIGRETDSSPTRTGAALHPILPGLPGERRGRLLYVTVAPSLLIIAMPDKVKYFLWLPTGPTSSVFGASWMFPESTIHGEGFLERWRMERDDLADVMKEDVYAWSTVQEGLRSRFAPRGRYAPTELVLVRLNQWLVERYEAAEAGRLETVS
jgi:phenylpropionate dioxygenase-like ring-hydroxylating dioxygenase large terminal subunit